MIMDSYVGKMAHEMASQNQNLTKEQAELAFNYLYMIANGQPFLSSENARKYAQMGLQRIEERNV